MRNPWLDLPERPPYVLAVDRDHVVAFERHASDRHRFDLRLMPGPFEGNRQARLLVLMRNPGIGDWGGDPRLAEYEKAMRANLGDDPGHHLQVGLLPEFEGTPAGNWSRGKCFKALIEEHGHEPEELARQVLNVEFHGYHSKNWQSLPVTLPSQHYSFWLVEQAMERRATIVVLRGQSDWEIAVPDLEKYPRLVPVHSARNPAITPGNCGERFNLVLEALAE
jgi:hypothetical protein